MSVVFDTLAYSKKLKVAGFNDKQAETLASAQVELIEEQLCTKRDLKELEQKLEFKIDEMAYKLTLRMGAMIAFAVTVVATLVKLL